jgi:hypothetical protein
VVVGAMEEDVRGWLLGLCSDANFVGFLRCRGLWLGAWHVGADGVFPLQAGLSGAAGVRRALRSGCRDSL